jgi:putative transcriptional regulator
VLQAVAQGNGPEKLLVTLGYSGWGAGQLESEIAQNAWLTVPASAEVIFATPPEDRYAGALKLLGIDPAMLSGVAGHA